MPGLPNGESTKESGHIVMYILHVKKNTPTKTSFHWFLDCKSVSFGVTTNDEAIPEAPSMSPLPMRRAAADKPIRHPPIKPVTGVK